MRINKFLLFSAVFMIFQACGKNDTDSGNAPLAAFSISGYETSAPATVTFINTSKNATTYLWNFGDGVTSTESNPTHVYGFPGTFLLRLTVTGNGATHTVCKQVTIETLAFPNKSAFSYFSEKCTGTPVGVSFKTVNPLSTNPVWDFGNGVVNVNRDPIIQFLVAGDYTIKYSTQINGVRDTVIRIIQIQ